MSKLNWRPTADLASLKLRAALLRRIRHFFEERNILEVDTPLLSHAPVTDPYLEALSVPYHQKIWYLQTSPEYAMKRLLCADSGSLYQISKAFRNDEKGRYHHPEFTLLEWYRVGFNHHDLMVEMDAFLQYVLSTQPAEKFSYEEIFEKHMGFNPHLIADNLLKETVISLLPSPELFAKSNLDRDDMLNLLMTHVIEPKLDKDHPVFIYDYPASQAALAKIRNDTPPVAERFEVYINTIELANGYHELTDAIEQRKRFEQDLKKRKALNYPAVPIDEHLLSALQHGLPDCAGVALGIDRLVMIAAKKEALSKVMAFTHDT